MKCNIVSYQKYAEFDLSYQKYAEFDLTVPLFLEPDQNPFLKTAKIL